MPPPPTAARVRPIENFAKAVGQCSTEASAYGKCIFQEYNDVYKDKCLTDFLRFKECVVAKTKRR